MSRASARPSSPTSSRRATTEGRSFKPKHNIAPRLGVNYAFAGGKTVVKGFWGRFYNELTTVLGNNSNPGGENYRIYKFNDVNGNRIYDGMHELGTLVSARGGISTTIDEDFKSPYADEISSAAGTSVLGRVVGACRLRAQDGARRDGRDQRGAGGPVHGAAHDSRPAAGVRRRHLGTETFTVFDIPDELRGVVQNVYSNWPDADYNYDTIQLGLNKRWPGGFFLQASFDYQWRDELRGGSGASHASPSRPARSTPIRLMSATSRTSGPTCRTGNKPRTGRRAWQPVTCSRYDIGVGVNYRVQSGYGFTRVIPVSLPNAGTAQFFYDDLDNQYSDTVPILDLRIDKTFVMRGRYRLGVNAGRLQRAQLEPGVELQYHQRHPVQSDHRHAGSTDGPDRLPVRVLADRWLRIADGFGHGSASQQPGV